MASGNHHASIGIKMPYGKIKHRGCAQPDIDDIDSRGIDPFPYRFMVSGRAETAVHAESHRLHAAGK